MAQNSLSSLGFHVAFATPNTVLTNVMACRVFRQLALGVDFLASSSSQPTTYDVMSPIQMLAMSSGFDTDNM